MSTHGPDVIDGERGIPAPGIRTSSRGRRTAVGGVLLLIVLATVGVVWWTLSAAGQDDEEPTARVRTELASTVPARSFPNPMELEPESEPAPENVVASIDPMPPPLPAPLSAPYVPAPIPVIAQSGDAPPPLPGDAEATTPAVLDKSAAPIVLAQNAPGADAAPGAAPTTRTDAGGDTGFVFGEEGAAGGSGADLGERLTPTRLDATLAGQLVDQSLLIPQGTMIDGALRTRIVSAVPGMAAATVTRNVYSADGRILLIERGSEVTGEYRSDVQQGTNRVFVLWSRVRTPDGVVVDLDSPATDPLGASGIPGEVDNHFWTRFGGAILLSLVDDVASAAAAGAASRDTDGTQVNVGGSINSGSRVVEEVLRQTINIPPTVSVDQGARVGIFVARDLDFRSVYRVAAR